MNTWLNNEALCSSEQSLVFQSGKNEAKIKVEGGK